MPLSQEEVRHVARLARLALTAEEIDALRDDLSAILDWVETVGRVATTEVTPTGQVYPLRNVARDDLPCPSLPPERAVGGAPHAEDGRFAVPPILEADA